jgi:hypothetical protein
MMLKKRKKENLITSQMFLDKLAIMWNKTKDPKYKDQWYKLVKELANGFNNTKRRTVPTNTRNR